MENNLQTQVDNLINAAQKDAPENPNIEAEIILAILNKMSKKRNSLENPYPDEIMRAIGSQILFLREISINERKNEETLDKCYSFLIDIIMKEAYSKDETEMEFEKDLSPREDKNFMSGIGAIKNTCLGSNYLTKKHAIDVIFQKENSVINLMGGATVFMSHFMSDFLDRMIEVSRDEENFFENYLTILVNTLVSTCINILPIGVSKLDIKKKASLIIDLENAIIKALNIHVQTLSATRH